MKIILGQYCLLNSKYIGFVNPNYLELQITFRILNYQIYKTNHLVVLVVMKKVFLLTMFKYTCSNFIIPSKVSHQWLIDLFTYQQNCFKINNCSGFINILISKKNMYECKSIEMHRCSLK